MISPSQKYLLEKAIRVATIPIRMLPSFIIIGSQKCGTSSLFNYLLEHPYVYPPQNKEPGYFSLKYKQGLAWYRRFFPTFLVKLQHPQAITGEASTGYICHPQVPDRIAQSLPQIKLIALLRNPIERAISHYHHTIRLGKESLPFEAAIAREAERLQGVMEKMQEDETYYNLSFHYHSYLSTGIYVDQLKPWFERFDKEQILIFSSEEFFASTEQIYQKTLDFLELPPWELENYQKYNQGKYKAIDPQTRQHLVDFFQPHNQRLYQYLGRDFDWH